MATQLTIVNNILRRLREDTVSSVDDNAYSTLIATFVNDALDDANDAWFWSVYQTQINVSVLIGDGSYDLATTNDKSFLIRHKRYDIPLAFDDTVDNSPFQLCLITERERIDIQTAHDFELTAEKPKYFSLALDPTGRFFVVNVLETPEADRTWSLYWYVPQYDLVVVGDDDNNTEIKINRQFIESRALFYALEERGEVLGPREASSAWMRTIHQLGAAIELDQQLQKHNEEYDLYNNEQLTRNEPFPLIGVS